MSRGLQSIKESEWMPLAKAAGALPQLESLEKMETITIPVTIREASGESHNGRINIGRNNNAGRTLQARLYPVRHWNHPTLTYDTVEVRLRVSKAASVEARAWLKTMKTPRIIISIKGEGLRGNAVPATKSTEPATFMTVDDFAHQAYDVQQRRCATCEREFGKWEETDANHRERLVPVQSHVLKPRSQGGIASDVLATCDLCNRFLNKQKGLSSLAEAKTRCRTFKERKRIKVVE